MTRQEKILAAVPPVERIEMVKGAVHVEESEPEWRVQVNGICADFPTQTWANNFRNAILALTEL